MGRVGCTDPDHRPDPALTAWTTELQQISAYDLAILALEKAKLTRWVTEPMKLALPDFDRREVVRAEKEECLQEYSI